MAYYNLLILATLESKRLSTSCGHVNALTRSERQNTTNLNSLTFYMHFNNAPLKNNQPLPRHAK